MCPIIKSGYDVNPKVTVLMSVYNGDRYLREAIESILSQTFTDFEFLIVNDGSTDSSKDIILTYNDSRIRLIDNGHNLGLTASLNHGLDLAKGEYIARMDADDISLPERLEKQVAFMDANNNIAVCGTCAEIINDKKERVGEFTNPELPDNIKTALFFFNPIAHPTVLMRKNIIIKAGKYNTEYLRTQDYELWIRLFLSGHEFYNLQERLIIYRNHENNITNSDLNNQLFYAEKSLQYLYKTYLNQNNFSFIKIFIQSLTSQSISISICMFFKFLFLLRKLKVRLQIDEKIHNFLWFNQIVEVIINKIKNAEDSNTRRYLMDRIIMVIGLYR
ncbi:MAG: glycosyltransferase [Spirochaetota bacterium]